MHFSTSIYVTGLLLLVGNVAAVPLRQVNAAAPTLDHSFTHTPSGRPARESYFRRNLSAQGEHGVSAHLYNLAAGRQEYAKKANLAAVSASFRIGATGAAAHHSGRADEHQDKSLANANSAKHHANQARLPNPGMPAHPDAIDWMEHAQQSAKAANAQIKAAEAAAAAGAHRQTNKWF